MSKENFERKIVIDEPTKQDFFEGKGHEKTARALAMAISEFENDDRSIGLDGAWGSGKSSIVAIAARQLESESNKDGTKFHFFTFDIWKSQGSAFRRTFLEHFVSWAKKEFPRKSKALGKIEQRIKGKTRHISTDINPMLDWYGVGILVILPFLPIFYFWAKEVFENSEGKDFLISTPMWLLYGFLVATIVRASFKYFLNNEDGKNTILGSLSRTLLITARQYENQKTTQHIREIDPNDFEFQETLTDILATVQGEKNKIVLVLDNIDRIPSEEIDDYWSAVRSIFSKRTSNKPEKPETVITAIVPYDRSHIQVSMSSEQNKSKTPDDGHDTQATLAKRELFSKTFDEILYVAPPVMSNSREFFVEKVSGALPNFSDDDELFRVYLIFISCLSSGNGHFTPRQIISFINELTSLFSMHRGQFSLSTVAVYICFREKIEQKPFTLTNPDFLGAKLRKLAPDQNIEQNLAAILYNVDSKFALELLLDGRIATASSQPDSANLVELSKSHGFDLRVDEVIQNYTQEWISSGDLGQVIDNYATLAEDYHGDAREQISQSLSNGFDDIEEISMSKDEYRLYFGLLSLCDESELSSIVCDIVSKGKESLLAAKKLEYADGRTWVEFLADLRDHLDEATSNDLIKLAVSTVSLPSNADFMLGVSRRSHVQKIPLTTYGQISFELSDDDTTLEDFAKENHHLSHDAFAELLNVKAIPTAKWIEVGNSIVSSLQDAEKVGTEEISDFLRTLVLIWLSIPDENRSEVSFEELLGSSQFYEGLHTAFGDNVEDQGVAQAVFIAHQTYLEKELPQTSEHQNGTISDAARAGYDWFKGIYDGEIGLNKEQLETVAQNAKTARKITGWVSAGSLYDIPLIDRVVGTSFRFEEIPFIKLITLLKNFHYFEKVLVEDFQPMLVKFGGRFDESDIRTIKLNQIPRGVLRLTQHISVGAWPSFHEEIKSKLVQIPADEWAVKLPEASDEVLLLAEKVQSSGIEIADSNFRAVFQKVALGILDGSYSGFENKIDFDLVFGAIPESFHGDIFRQCRENLSSVSSPGLELAASVFPNFLKNVVSSGDRIMAEEKENVVRHLLSTALESNNRYALDCFLELGRPKVADFIKHSDDATNDLLRGAMDEFTKLSTDRSFTRQVSDLVNGKRKTKSLWEIWFSPVTGSPDGEVEEESES